MSRAGCGDLSELEADDRASDANHMTSRPAASLNARSRDARTRSSNASMGESGSDKGLVSDSTHHIDRDISEMDSGNRHGSTRTTPQKSPEVHRPTASAGAPEQPCKEQDDNVSEPKDEVDCSGRGSNGYQGRDDWNVIDATMKPAYGDELTAYFTDLLARLQSDNQKLEAEVRLERAEREKIADRLEEREAALTTFNAELTQKVERLEMEAEKLLIRKVRSRYFARECLSRG
jgi:hypothetical protein